MQSFKGGQLARFLEKWKEITSDSEVLNCVKGQYIEFSTQPTKNLGPKRKTFNISDSLVIEAEIQKLLDKGVIEPTQHESGEYISPILEANKKDGSYRMILNLKSFNQHVEYQHFKKCAKNVVHTVKLLDTLGFIVHPEKSVFIPTQKLLFLGFILDSVSMLVYHAPEKALKLQKAATDLFNCKNPTIREVAKVLGLKVSSFPGVAYGPLHYRYLERDKTTALKTSKWNFDAKMGISSQGREELKWWID